MSILKNSNLRKNFLIIKMSRVEKSIYEESSESETDSLLTDSLSSQSSDSDIYRVKHQNQKIIHHTKAVNH